MEYTDRVLCGTGEVELDPNIVSEEAGKLYTELQVRSFLLHYSVQENAFLNEISVYICLCTPAVSLGCFAQSQTVIETHGEGVVATLVPIFVWVLEGLAGCKAQLRDREEEAEREKAEREELLERYQAERALRKGSQEVGDW